MAQVATEYSFQKLEKTVKSLGTAKIQEIHGEKGCLATILNHCIAGSDAYHHCRMQRRVQCSKGLVQNNCQGCQAF